MSEIMDDIFKQVCDIVNLLVLRKFDEVESITKGVRLSSQQIKEAIDTYGRTLIELPLESIDLLDAVKVDSNDFDTWSVVMPLWTKEEGRSDLSIEMTIVSNEGSFDVEIDDIHVL